MIRNQSTIVQIPKPPQVINLAIPNPVSPIKKRSIPNEPANREIIKQNILLSNSLFALFFVILLHHKSLDGIDKAGDAALFHLSTGIRDELVMQDF